MSRSFVFDANVLALDLLNTEQWSDGPVDLLETPDDLQEWLALACEHWSLPSPAVDTGLLAEGHRVRGTIRRIVEALREDRPPPTEAIEQLNADLHRWPPRTTVFEEGGRFHRTEGFESEDPASVFGPIVASAAELLTELDPRRIGVCRSEECVLYYYDVSKNRSRRWCSMERCGNRAKVAAHYRRESSSD